MNTTPVFGRIANTGKLHCGTIEYFDESIILIHFYPVIYMESHRNFTKVLSRLVGPSEISVTCRKKKFVHTGYAYVLYVRVSGKGGASWTWAHVSGGGTHKTTGPYSPSHCRPAFFISIQCQGTTSMFLESPVSSEYC